MLEFTSQEGKSTWHLQRSLESGIHYIKASLKNPKSQKKDLDHADKQHTLLIYLFMLLSDWKHPNSTGWQETAWDTGHYLSWDLIKVFPWKGAKWQTTCKGGKAQFHPLAAHTHLSLRFLDREMERDRERDLEKERERDLDPDLEREERDPDLDLFVLDILASTCQCTWGEQGNRRIWEMKLVVGRRGQAAPGRLTDSRDVELDKAGNRNVWSAC